MEYTASEYREKLGGTIRTTQHNRRRDNRIISNVYGMTEDGELYEATIHTELSNPMGMIGLESFVQEEDIRSRLMNGTLKREDIYDEYVSRTGIDQADQPQVIMGEVMFVKRPNETIESLSEERVEILKNALGLAIRLFYDNFEYDISLFPSIIYDVKVHFTPVQSLFNLNKPREFEQSRSIRVFGTTDRELLKDFYQKVSPQGIVERIRMDRLNRTNVNANANVNTSYPRTSQVDTRDRISVTTQPSPPPSSFTFNSQNSNWNQSQPSGGFNFRPRSRSREPSPRTSFTFDDYLQRQQSGSGLGQEYVEFDETQEEQDIKLPGTTLRESSAPQNRSTSGFSFGPYPTTSNTNVSNTNASTSSGFSFGPLPNRNSNNNTTSSSGFSFGPSPTTNNNNSNTTTSSGFSFGPSSSPNRTNTAFNVLNPYDVLDTTDL